MLSNSLHQLLGTLFFQPISPMASVEIGEWAAVCWHLVSCGPRITKPCLWQEQRMSGNWCLPMCLSAHCGAPLMTLEQSNRVFLVLFSASIYNGVCVLCFMYKHTDLLLHGCAPVLGRQALLYFNSLALPKSAVSSLSWQMWGTTLGSRVGFLTCQTPPFRFLSLQDLFLSFMYTREET